MTNTGSQLLREWLTLYKVSAEQFAQLGGFHFTTVYRWLRLAAVPPVRNAIAVERLTSGYVPVASWGTPISENPQP